jgi:hypothetical protein
MGKRILQNKKKTITAVLITLLLLIFLLPILIVASHLHKPYPNSARIGNQTETISASHTRATIISSHNRTTDSREIVTDWYA